MNTHREGRLGSG